MSQLYTSARTSINSGRLPAVYSKARFDSHFVLDYGCGKYTDHIREHLRRQGCILLPYDPYNQPQEVNEHTIKAIWQAIDLRYPLDVVCSNVLNVINDDTTVRFIAETIENIVEKTDGTAYITVYEGDRSGHGRQTGTDQYQRNEPLRNYLRFFRNGIIKNGMIVIRPVSA